MQLPACFLPADGYTLRCDWSRSGTREDKRFLEIAPGR